MAAPIQTEEIVYHRKFNFRVDIDGVEAGHFASVTSPDSEFTVIEQPEGGSLTNQTTPGKRKFSPVTVKRGQSDNRELWTWHDSLGDAVSNAGVVDKRTVSIVVLKADQTEHGRWILEKAYPSKYVPGEFDGSDETANAMEEVTFTYRYARWEPA